MFVVSRRETRVVSFVQVTAECVVEQATEPASSEPTPPSGQLSRILMFDSLPRDSSPIFPL